MWLTKALKGANHGLAAHDDNNAAALLAAKVQVFAEAAALSPNGL